MKTIAVALAVAGTASAFGPGFMGQKLVAPASTSMTTSTTMMAFFGGKKPAATAKTAAKQAPAKVANTVKKAASKVAPKPAQKAAIKQAPAKVVKNVKQTIKKVAPKSIPKPSAPKPAIKKAPVSSPDFAAGLIGSDVETPRFDPWGLSAERSPEGLAWFRASELKHGRICMLAALGLFTQSLYHLPDDVFSNPKGLDALFQVASERPQAIAQILLAIGAIEVAGLSASEGKDAGDYGFDPLGLKPKTGDALAELQLKEIKNGRLAMVSVAGMLVQESLTKQGVLEQINSGHLSPFGDGQGVF